MTDLPREVATEAISAGLVRVLLVSGSSLVRLALRQLLSASGEAVVVGESGDSDAVSMISRAFPDIVVCDTQWVDEPFASRLQQITRAAPRARVIILSDDDSDNSLLNAAQPGVWGLLPRDISQDELVRAVRVVAQGKALLGCPLSFEQFSRLALIRRRVPARTFTLSEKETSVIRAMANGQTDSQIARQLGLSVPTIKTHVRSILRKTSSKNRAGAIAAAFRNGMLC